MLLTTSLMVLDAGLFGVSAWLALFPSRLGDSSQRREAEAYAAYRKRFGPSQIGPAECRSAADLAELEAALAGPLAPPPEYAQTWRETAAVQLYRKWLLDASLVRRHQATLAEWYRSLAHRGTELLLTKYDASWAASAAALVAESATPPFPRTGSVPESPKLNLRRGAALTFEGIVESDLVEQAERDWKATVWRLSGLPGLWDLFRQVAGWPAIFSPGFR
jgi:hypothetical protein